MRADLRRWLFLISLMAALYPAVVFAQNPADIPMPPPRPPGIGSEPAPVSPPEQSTAISNPAPPVMKVPEEQHPLLRPGPIAPRRPAIRACIREWRALQDTGLARGALWRDFSEECMERKLRNIR